MGYADTLPYQNLTITTGLKQGITLTSVVANYTIADFVIPNFKRPISHAYVDLVVECVEDTSGFENEFQEGSFGILDSGATFRTSNSLTANTLMTPASTFLTRYWVYPGVNNLSAYITPGSTQSFRFNQTRATGDFLILRDIYGIMRLYFSI